MTINLVFKIPSAIVYGVDSRINAGSYIESDQDDKLFTLYSTRDETLFCTLMGHYNPWHEMFNEIKHVVKPKTVEAAYNAVKSYMNNLKKQSREERGKSKEFTFGTIIIGEDKLKGTFEFKSIEWIAGKIIEHKNGTKYTVIGSGAEYALPILSDNTSSEEDLNHLNPDEAKLLALKAMFNSSVYDRQTGGNFRVTISHEGGWKTEYWSALEVYKAHQKDIEEQTLLLFYPKEHGQIYGETAENDLIKAISSGPKFSNNVTASHVIARTSEYYIHRIVYNTVNDAQEAYAEIEKIKSGSIPDSLDAVRHLLWSTKHPYYIGKSSSVLLQAFLDMDPPDNLVYFKGVI